MVEVSVIMWAEAFQLRDRKKKKRRAMITHLLKGHRKRAMSTECKRLSIIKQIHLQNICNVTSQELFYCLFQWQIFRWAPFFTSVPHFNSLLQFFTSVQVTFTARKCHVNSKEWNHSQFLQIPKLWGESPKKC